MAGCLCGDHLDSRVQPQPYEITTISTPRPGISFAALEAEAIRADNTDVARLLVIDDDVDMCRAVRLILESKGHLVTLSDDGHRGWATARRQRPDLIVLDIMMPVMDGYGVLEMLREDERTKDIPCVIVSALRASEAEERARTLGAVGYVEKPFDWDDLIDTIESALLLTPA